MQEKTNKIFTSDLDVLSGFVDKQKTKRIAAEMLEMSPQQLNNILKGKAPVGAAIRERLRKYGYFLQEKSGWDLVENKPRIIPSPVKDYVVSVPMFLTSPVKAGTGGLIPELADAYMQPAKYFNEKTQMIRVDGDSMEDIGIKHGSYIVVDREREARNGSIVVVRIGTGWTVKLLEIEFGVYFLVSMNGSKKYERIKFDKGLDAEILGEVLMISTVLKEI